MRRKTIVLAAAIITSICIWGCSGAAPAAAESKPAEPVTEAVQPESEAVQETKAEETEQTAAVSEVTIDQFVGTWGAERSRWTITKDGDDKVKVEYQGSDSAREGRTGYGTGELKDGVLCVDIEYTNYMYGNKESQPAVMSVGTCVDKVIPAAAIPADYCCLEGEGLEGSWDAGLTPDKLEVYTMEEVQDPSKYVLWSSPLISMAGPSSQYVLWYSDQITLTKDDLAGMSKDDLRTARNEIYARHGRKFNDKDIQEGFNNREWYKGTIEPDQFDDSVLSEIEKENLKVIKECEEEAQ